MQPKISEDTWLRKLHIAFIQSPYGRGGLCFGRRQPPSLFASKPSPCRGVQEFPASPGTHVSLLWRPGYRKNGTYVPYHWRRVRIQMKHDAKGSWDTEGLFKMACGALNTEFRSLAVGSSSHGTPHSAPKLQQAPV